MIRSLDGEKPGHQTRYKDSKRNVLRSTANDRAREGFRYWVLDKPVPQGSFVQLILINFFYHLKMDIEIRLIVHMLIRDVNVILMFLGL